MDVRGEKDIEQLRRIALAQQVQIDQLIKVLAAQSRRIDELVGKDGELQQALSLLEELGARAPQASTPAAGPDDELKKEKKKKPRTKSGPTAQPLLSVVEQVFELDEPDRTCPSCGGDLAPMKDQYETSELVDVVEVSYRIVKAKQQKYVCRCGGCVETAPGPERAVRGGRYSLDFAIKVAIDKYLDHAPLARQVRILLRHGVETTTQTLWDQVHAVGSELRPVYDALFARLLRRGVIGLDQTSWKRLEQKGAKPWQMWCITSPDTVYHRICDDKGKDTFTSLLGGYRGVIVCDALSTHGAGARDAPGIALAGCWAHVFRKFREAEPDHPEAVLAMKWIESLYEIDRRAGDDQAARAALRRTESAAVLAELKAWLFIQAPLKTLSIGAAARYALGNWERLTRFVDDPLIPLDNNQTERGIRGPVVGRKNHYGSKSRRGTEIAAILYTLIETAKLNDLDPARYLRDAVIAIRRGELVLPLPSPAA
jgi:transposase